MSQASPRQNVEGSSSLVYILRKHPSIGLWYCSLRDKSPLQGNFVDLGGLLNAIGSIT
jgi:hypothetical protein